MSECEHVRLCGPCVLYTPADIYDDDDGGDTGVRRCRWCDDLALRDSIAASLRGRIERVIQERQHPKVIIAGLPTDPDTMKFGELLSVAVYGGSPVLSCGSITNLEVYGGTVTLPQPGA